MTRRDTTPFDPRAGWSLCRYGALAKGGYDSGAFVRTRRPGPGLGVCAGEVAPESVAFLQRAVRLVREKGS
jgi:hypothetical protein